MSSGSPLYSLQNALGASAIFHGLVVFALWDARIEGAPLIVKEPTRIAVSLVSNAARTSAEPELAERTPAAPPVMAAPPPIVQPPAKVVKAKPPVSRPVVREIPAASVPLPTPESASLHASPDMRRANQVTPGADETSEDDANLAKVLEGERTHADRAAPDAMPIYAAEVRRRIESKKRYPSLARRRREEGRVLARVLIDSSGALRGVELGENAPLSLRRATRSAIEGAAPFPSPPRGEVMVEVPVLWQVRR